MLEKAQSNYLRKRTWAEVNLDHLEHNYHIIKETLDSNVKMMSVVKGDAYGHGMIAVAKELDRLGTDWFGVNEVDEGIKLRKAGITKPILVFTPPQMEYVDLFLEHDLILTISSYDYGVELDKVLGKKKTTLSVHLKIDSGMARQGIKVTRRNYGQMLEVIEKLYNLKHLDFTGIFTHFASSDCVQPELVEYKKMQFELFDRILGDIEKKGMDFGLHHCANSASIVCDKEYHLDMVRAGIILYGCSPGERTDDVLPLKPVMSVFSRLTNIKEVDAGQAVSYGCEYVSINTIIVGVVAAGYADGYPRGLGGKSFMLHRNKRVENIGRICMDQQMLDLTFCEPKIGDVITLVGEEIAWDLLAAIYGTINYELMCMLSNRVPRIYMRAQKDESYLYYNE